MHKVFTKNRIVGLLMLVLGIAVFIVCSQYPAPRVSGDVGSGVFPMISVGICVICGCLLLLPNNQKDNAKGSLTKKQWLKVLTVFGLYVAYYALLSVFGYWVATLVIVFSTFYVMSRNESVPIWKGLLYAAIVTVSVYLLFNKAFHIRLPKGIVF